MDDHTSAAKCRLRGENLNEVRFDTADANCELAVKQRVRDFNVMVRRSGLWGSLILSFNLVDNTPSPSAALRRPRLNPYARR
jgi:hypothetical protein